MSGSASVAVVIPARDRAGVLRDALASVFAQTLRPQEIFVVDDGSSDATAAVAREFEDVQVLVHPQPLGSGPARNTGIRAASTRWIAFLDSDDEWLPHHLEHLCSRMAEHVLVTAAAVDTNGRGWGNVSGERIALTPARCFAPQSPIVTSAVVADRRALLDAGLFGEFKRAQDAEMWARVLELGTGVALPDATVIYRVESGKRERGAVDRDQAGLREVMASLSERSWMSSNVRLGMEVRLQWDDMRRSLADGQRSAARRAARWIVAHPSTWPGLVGMLRTRRRSRDDRWKRILESRPTRGGAAT